MLIPKFLCSLHFAVGMRVFVVMCGFNCITFFAKSSAINGRVWTGYTSTGRTVQRDGSPLRSAFSVKFFASSNKPAWPETYTMQLRCSIPDTSVIAARYFRKRKNKEQEGRRKFKTGASPSVCRFVQSLCKSQ